MSTIPLTEARNDLPKIVKQVDETFERFTITVNGRPKATIISPEEIAAYETTIEILSNSETMKDLQQAEVDYQSGNVHTLEDVFGDMA